MRRDAVCAQRPSRSRGAPPLSGPSLPNLDPISRTATMREARLRIRELETELAVHRRAAELLKEAVRTVYLACLCLATSSGGSGHRPRGRSGMQHAWLTAVIREVHAESYSSYGARRVYAGLTLGRGIQVGHNAVTMLMHRAGAPTHAPNNSPHPCSPPKSGDRPTHGRAEPRICWSSRRHNASRADRLSRSEFEGHEQARLQLPAIWRQEFAGSPQRPSAKSRIGGPSK